MLIMGQDLSCDHMPALPGLGECFSTYANLPRKTSDIERHPADQQKSNASTCSMPRLAHRWIVMSALPEGHRLKDLTRAGCFLHLGRSVNCEADQMLSGHNSARLGGEENKPK